MVWEKTDLKFWIFFVDHFKWCINPYFSGSFHGYLSLWPEANTTTASRNLVIGEPKGVVLLTGIGFNLSMEK